MNALCEATLGALSGAADLCDPMFIATIHYESSLFAAWITIFKPEFCPNDGELQILILDF